MLRRMPDHATVLFDLDGTLIDPLEGITRSIQYALERSGVANHTTSELAAYIGPPLRGTFASLLETDDPMAVETALSFYRERFSTVGLFENTVYAGVPEMLASLQSQGPTLYVATAKPHIYAERIVEHLGLAPFFTAVYGPELDGRMDDKRELLAHLQRNEKLSHAATIMVGDRSHDIVAAKENAVMAIGVSYGYGSRGELQTAGADFVCDDPSEVGTCVLRWAPTSSR
jgi:phosphoglycolate phosphatase